MLERIYRPVLALLWAITCRILDGFAVVGRAILATYAGWKQTAKVTAYPLKERAFRYLDRFRKYPRYRRPQGLRRDEMPAYVPTFRVKS
mmetsp:Transcript_131752/g.299574  ORF Transcript_131752/g.299574 Transcript_131752/m.299574 type:complete len:89 (-) Transcript_131752:202-468(-)